MPNNVKDVIRRVGQLFSTDERENARTMWEEIAEFIFPNQSMHFTGEDVPGAKKTSRVFDSTAPQANHDLAAAINATLTNPATEWAQWSISHADAEIQALIDADPESQEWIQNAQRKFHSELDQSNFYKEIAKGYQFFTSLGNMCLMMESKSLTDTGSFPGFQFKAWHLAEIAWSENALGIVDEIARKYRWTARKIYSQWGQDSSPSVIDALRQNPDKKFTVLHYIYPREDKDIKTTESGLVPAKHRPYASVYILKEDEMILSEDGYYEFPTMVTRYDTMPEEEYGRGPGVLAMPDIRTLNRTKELSLRAAAKALDPSVIVQDKNMISAIDLRPGRPTVVKDITQIREWVTQTRFDVSQFVVEDLRSSIRSSFFLDKLFLPDRTEIGEMTAFETARRTEELQRVLGPTLGRLNSELLDPIIKRGFNLMLRGNGFDPLPELLREHGLGLEVEYVNSLARSQKFEDIQALQSWGQMGAMFAELGKPEALDIFNVDGAMRLAAKIMGVPTEGISSDKDVQEAREQRAQQIQQQQALEAGVKMADIASKADTVGDV